MHGVEDLLQVDALADLSHGGEGGCEAVGVIDPSDEFADHVLERVPARLRGATQLLMLCVWFVVHRAPASPEMSIDVLIRGPGDRMRSAFPGTGRSSQSTDFGRL